MKFMLVDYSRIECEGKPLSPKGGQHEGKFVQVRDGSSEYLVLALKSQAAYHANVAERFFSDMGVTGSYDSRRDHYSVKDPGWTIVGGGHWKIDCGRGELELSGVSMAFGGFDRAGLARKLRATGRFKGFDIVID